MNWKILAYYVVNFEMELIVNTACLEQLKIEDGAEIAKELVKASPNLWMHWENMTPCVQTTSDKQWVQQSDIKLWELQEWSIFVPPKHVHKLKRISSRYWRISFRASCVLGQHYENYNHYKPTYICIFLSLFCPQIETYNFQKLIIHDSAMWAMS